MNSLFSEFFKKFGGVFLEVCETIFWGYLGGKWRNGRTEGGHRRREEERGRLGAALKHFLLGQYKKI